MKLDVVEAYAALRRDHPARPLPRDLEEWMILEVDRLRSENADLRIMVDGLETAAHEERAAVVAWLRHLRTSTNTSEAFCVAADCIERGEHRREEER